MLRKLSNSYENCTVNFELSQPQDILMNHTMDYEEMKRNKNRIHYLLLKNYHIQIFIWHSFKFENIFLWRTSLCLLDELLPRDDRSLCEFWVSDDSLFKLFSGPFFLGDLDRSPFIGDIWTNNQGRLKKITLILLSIDPINTSKSRLMHY